MPCMGLKIMWINAQGRVHFTPFSVVQLCHKTSQNLYSIFVWEMARAKQMVDLLMFVTNKHTSRNKAMVKYYHKIYVKREIIELTNGMIDDLRFCGRSVFYTSWNPIQVFFYNYNLLSISTK